MESTPYFTYESLGTLVTLYHCQSYHETQDTAINSKKKKVLKISRRGSRFPDNAELGHFTLFRGTEMYQEL